MSRLIECVPNFSEGRDMGIIKQITDTIEAVEGVMLLDVDPGKDTNRTVVTMVGEPEQVIEAAFNAIKRASELIDMSKHQGEHPRMGATDVCPLVPVSGITMDETVEYAHMLAQRVGDKLGIPVYCLVFLLLITYSIIFSSGLNSYSSSRPIDLTAILISSLSETPEDLSCIVR